jgi:hypothetical protein
VNVRVFLAAYMIAFRPTHVFESMGALEKTLFDAALQLLTRFQDIVQRIASTGSFQCVAFDLTCDFPLMIFEYLKHFKAWKVPDEVKLTCRIKHALIALYNAEQQLPHDEPDDSKLKIEFRTQIERLRGKLAQIAGAQELARFDADRIIPIHRGGGGGGGGAYAALAGRMTNEQLAHELLLDPAFQLDDAGTAAAENAIYHRIRESFHQVGGVANVVAGFISHPHGRLSGTVWSTTSSFRRRATCECSACSPRSATALLIFRGAASRMRSPRQSTPSSSGVR